jgi:flagellar biosynthesis GTPase FlhF
MVFESAPPAVEETDAEAFVEDETEDDEPEAAIELDDETDEDTEGLIELDDDDTDDESMIEDDEPEAAIELKNETDEEPETIASDQPAASIYEPIAALTAPSFIAFDEFGDEDEWMASALSFMNGDGEAESSAMVTTLADLDPELRTRAGELEEHLLDRGFSAARAGELITSAIGTLDPECEDTTVVDRALEAAIVSALPMPRSVPVGAVAVVGAGGSGKTHAVAALAAAHARVVVMPVSVARLEPGTEDELAELLAGEPVRILPAMSAEAMDEAVTAARQGGLVLIDTAAAAPRDAAAMEILADKLSPMELDGVYLTVPATMSARAAAKLVEGFSALHLTAMIVTHMDEADELGTVAELAMSTGVPITYAHAGTSLQTSITSAHREQLATQLLK